MKHLIIAIAVLAVSASAWAESGYYMVDVDGVRIYLDTTTPADAITAHPDNMLAPGTVLTYSPTPEDCTITLPPDARLESRIAKLEAELRRVAALVYRIHGGGRWETKDVDMGGFDMQMLTGDWIPNCSVVVPLTQEDIDQCLREATIEEEKE